MGTEPAPSEESGDAPKRRTGGILFVLLIPVIVVAVGFLWLTRPSEQNLPPPSVITATSVPRITLAPPQIEFVSPLEPALPTSTVVPVQPTAVSPAPQFNCQPGITSGRNVYVVYRAVRMRLSPGFVTKDDATDSVHYLKTGEIVSVLAGPQIADGLCWWLVEHAGYTGWSADHSREGRVLLSPSP